jgi:NhaP-type Na+/H+ or K+/H+ antiporter
MYLNMAILAVFVFIYSILSTGLARTPINGAIVFIAFGLALGPLGLGLLNLNVDAQGLRTLAELTLALVLFTDAANANLRELKHSYRIPLRLLLIGLPLTILFGYVAGVFVFDDLTVLEVAILATMLAPTDAALGKAVVTDKSVPSSIREALNVESGLNDGICVPILFIFLVLVARTGAEVSTPLLALKLLAGAIGIGVAAGLVLVLLAVKVLAQCAERGWISDTWQQLSVPALALACFAVAQWLGGSGFIACFVGGIVFGGLEKQHKDIFLHGAEGTGDVLALITWVVFGAAVVGQGVGHFTWEIVLYSLLSLTVVRMLPVFLALTMMKIPADEKLFIGWFGPRGLASIVFAVIVLDENLLGGDMITSAVVCTIIMSVIFHGLSANPLIAALVQRLKRSKG